jgi:hypothetical protein
MTIKYDQDHEAGEAESMASLGAEFVGQFLMSQHRGVLDCGDHFLIFGNDGYTNDPRSHREAEIVLQHFKEDSPTLGFNEGGYSWAIVLTDYQRSRFDRKKLEKLVWDAWATACAEVKDTANTLVG